MELMTMRVDASGHVLADAELVILPGVGHWAQVEAPDAVVAALDRWLCRRGGIS